MSDSEKPALRPANDNPWYCLATLHGEQPIDRLDQELAGKNQRAWQQWISGILKSDKREEFLSTFAARTGGQEPPSQSTERLDFSHTHFDRTITFEGFLFPWPTDFSSAKFSREANFGGAQFHSKTSFASATFSGEVDFSRAQFNAQVGFQSAVFSNAVYFQNANFVDPDFRSVTFLGRANFFTATFSGALRITDFSSATFSDIADFGSALFHNEADFESAKFVEMANFRSATFSGEVDFTETTFNSVIHFNNATFAKDTIFADARFETQVPDFRGATMHEATEWHGVTWPKPPKDEYFTQQQVYAYERLKQEMERLKKHEDEQNFFRRELRARRGLVRPLSGGWLLNFVYQASSDYGSSSIRPLLWLSGVFAVGAAIFSHAPLYCGAPMPIKPAAKLSFFNIFAFLPDRREIVTTANMVECMSNTTQAVSAVQSLLGVVLLFLLGLALRNRFRMK